MGTDARPETPLMRIVRSLDPGGQSKYARIVGKHQSTISERLKGNGEILPGEVLAIAAATGIPKEELRPDLFGQPAGPAGVPATDGAPA